MKCKFLIIPSLLLLTTGCNIPELQPFHFDPDKIDNKEIFLTEIANDISYLPLDNAFPIGTIYDNIEFINENIYLSVRDVGILAFNREGKLISKIGTIGRGPGEYTYYFLFTIDDKNENVYVFDTGYMIKVFSKTGRFVRQFSVKDYGHTEKMKFFNSKLFVLQASQFNNTENEWVFLDTLGNVVKKHPRKHPQFATNWGSSYPVYKFNEAITYYNIFGDTEYAISADINEIPVMTINQGAYRLPKENLTVEQMLSKKYLMISKLQETKKFFLIRYSLNGNFLVMADKIDHSTKSVSLEYLNSVYINGITNDIDGGVYFLPDHYFTADGHEYLIGIQYPHQILSRAASKEFKEAIPKVPAKKMEFEKLAARLKETDNPVLVIVKLKD